MGPRYALNIPQAWKSFWMHLIELQGDLSCVESRFGLFGDSVRVGARWVPQARKLFWTHMMVLLGDVGH
jgi:hypothetical protein